MIFDSGTCPTPEPFSEKKKEILFVSLLFLLGFLSRVIFSPLMPTLERELGIGHSAAGSFFLVMAFGFVFGQIGNVHLASRIHHRGTIVISAIGTGLTLLPFVFVESYIMLLPLLFGLGMFAGLYLPSSVAAIAGMVRQQDWGKAMGLHQTAPPVALILAPLLVETTLNIVSWRTILLILGITSLAAGAAFHRFCRCGDFSPRSPDLSSVFEMLRLPSFWIMGTLFVAAISGALGIYSMLPLYLVSEKGMDPALANTLVGASRISGLFMTFFGGWMSDRFGVKNTILIVLPATGAATIILSLVSGNALTIMIFLQPMLISSYFAAGFSALSRATPSHLRSLATAYVPAMAFILGGGIFPTLIGFMGDTVSFSAGITLTGMFILLPPLLLPFLTFHSDLERQGC